MSAIYYHICILSMLKMIIAYYFCGNYYLFLLLQDFFDEYNEQNLFKTNNTLTHKCLFCPFDQFNVSLLNKSVI